MRPHMKPTRSKTADPRHDPPPPPFSHPGSSAVGSTAPRPAHDPSAAPPSPSRPLIQPVATLAPPRQPPQQGAQPKRAPRAGPLVLGTKRPAAVLDSQGLHDAACGTLRAIMQGAPRSPALTQLRATIQKMTELVANRSAYFSLGKYSYGAQNAVQLSVHIPGVLKGTTGHLFIRGVVVLGGKALLKHPSLAAQIYRLVMGRGKKLSVDGVEVEEVLKQMAAFTEVVCRRTADTPELPHSLHHIINMPTPNLIIQNVKTAGWENICSQMTIAAVFGVAAALRTRDGGIVGSKTSLRTLLKTVSSSSGCSTVLGEIGELMGADDDDYLSDSAPAAIALRMIAPRGRAKARADAEAEAAPTEAAVRFRKVSGVKAKAVALAMRVDFSLDLLQVPRACKHMRRVVTAVKCTTCKVGVREACLSCHIPCITCRSFSSTTDNPALDRHLPPPAAAAADSAPQGELLNSLATTPLPPVAGESTGTPAADSPPAADDMPANYLAFEPAEEDGVSAAVCELEVAVEEWACEVVGGTGEGAPSSSTVNAAPWRKRTGQSYQDVMGGWIQWLGKSPGRDEAWLWLREGIRAGTRGEYDWRPDVALNVIAMRSWRYLAGSSVPTTLEALATKSPMVSPAVPRWNGTVAHLRVVSEAAPWYGQVVFQTPATGRSERPIDRALFLAPGSTITDWLLRNITESLPFIAFIDPALFVAPSLALANHREIAPRHRTIEARCGEAGVPQAIVLSPTLLLRLLCPFFYRGHAPPSVTDKTASPIILYCPYFAKTNVETDGGNHELAGDVHTSACAVLVWSERMVAVVADSAREPGRLPSPGEQQVLQLLCSVAHQEYGVPVPKRILELTHIRQERGSNDCTVIVAAVFPYALASLRYNISTDSYELGAELLKSLATPVRSADLRAAVASGIRDPCGVAADPAGAPTSSRQKVTWSGTLPTNVLIPLVQNLHRRFHYRGAIGMDAFPIQGEGLRHQFYIKGSVGDFRNVDLPYFEYMMEKADMPPVPPGFRLVVTSFAMLSTILNGLTQVLHRDGDGGEYYDRCDFAEATTDKTLRGILKREVSNAWGPYSFLVNPSNGTRRILVLDCVIPRGEFPTEQQIRQHMKYQDIPPHGWTAFPITTWHSGGPGPTEPPIYPVGSPVFFGSAWAVNDKFLSNHSVANGHAMADALKWYVHSSAHVDIIGRAPTEDLRLAYVGKLLDLGITAVAGFGGGAFNKSETRVYSHIMQLSRKGATVRYVEERTSRTEAEVRATTPAFEDWLTTLRMLESELRGEKPDASLPADGNRDHPLFHDHPDLLGDIEDAVRYAVDSERAEIKERIRRLGVDTRGMALPQWPADVKFSGTEPFRLALWFCPGGTCKGYTLRCTQRWPPESQQLPVVLYTEKSMLMESVKRNAGAQRRWSWEKPKKGTTTEETRGAAVSKELIDVGVRNHVSVCIFPA